MSGAQLHETRMGQRFYDSTMPRIAEALEKLAAQEIRMSKSDQDSILSLLNEIQEHLAIGEGYGALKRIALLRFYFTSRGSWLTLEEIEEEMNA
jgi:hypothetical protein